MRRWLVPALLVAFVAACCRAVKPGGLLVIHDVFPDPRDGGRPPYEVWLRAKEDGFEELSATGSLRVLRKP